MGEERDYRKEELWQQSLIGNCQDIITGIGKLKSDSYQRAIWELVQNARDASSGDCIINIQLFKDKLVFSHNGEPFNIKSLGALIMQNSAKFSNDDTKVGQYGTGFMITHIFNHVVHIDGIFDDVDQNGNHIAYYPINHFEIDREADTPEQLLQKMKSALDAMLAIPNEKSLPNKKGSTSFTYELTEEKANLLDEHLRRIINFIPIVLILNKSIKKISISSECSNIQQSFSLEEEIFNEPINEYNNWRLLKQSIHVTKKDGEESIEIHSLQSEEGKDIIVIPPYHSCIGDIKEMPSLFLNFPLLGTERFGVNFVFHSKDFFPVEERNGIMLPHKFSQYPYKPQKNKEALTRMFEVLFAYYGNHSNAKKLPMDSCRVEFINNEMLDDEELTNFYRELQQLWAEQICNWKIIPTTDNKRSSIKDNNVCVLDAVFYNKLKEDDISKYEKTIASFASQTRLSNGDLIILPEKDLIEWSSIVNNWNANGKTDYVVTLKEVCKSVNPKNDDLHNFLKLLNEIDSKEIFETFPLIPNREKDTLCFRSELRDGKTISKDLYQLARPILQEKLDCLVDEQYADLYEFSEYTRSDLQNDMTAKTTALRKVTFAKQIDPISLEELDKGDIMLNALLEYCYAFPNNNTTSLRREIVPIIRKIYQIDDEVLQPHIISNEGSYIKGNTIDIYESAFNYLLDNTLFVLSRKEPSWVNENKNTLLELLTILKTKTNDQDHHKRLINNAVFPNQLGQMRKAENLKRCDVINSVFVDEYNKLLGVNLRETWVDNGFANLLSFQDEKPKELGRQIEEKLEPYLDEKRKHVDDLNYACNAEYEKCLLTIVHHLEHGEWHDYFDHFVSRLYEISFELGSKRQKEDLYTIKMNISDEKTLHDIAELSKNPSLCDILKTANKQLEQEKEKVRQFQFTLALGKQIEDAIRNEVNSELSIEFCNSPEQVSTKDEQRGQDIIIQDKEGNDLYYIECKAKWSFHEKAHMSSLQVKKAVQRKDNYALLCVYCAEDGANISTEATELDLQSNIEKILVNTKAHLEIGNKFQKPINALITYENETINEDEEQNIKLYDNVGCNIPKPVFTEGMSFADFMEHLKSYLQKSIVRD